MQKELDKFNVRLEWFNIDAIRKMTLTQFEKSMKGNERIGENAKEIYSILAPTSKKK